MAKVHPTSRVGNVAGNVCSTAAAPLFLFFFDSAPTNEIISIQRVVCRVIASSEWQRFCFISGIAFAFNDLFCTEPSQLEFFLRTIVEGMRSLFYIADSEWQLKHNRMEKRIKIHHCGEPKTSAGVGGGSFNETSE